MSSESSEVVGFKREECGFSWTSKTGRHWFNVTLVNDWPEWLPWNRRKYNWRNFRLADVQCEDDRVCAGWELNFVLLGLGFLLRYTDQLMFETTEVAARYHEAMDGLSCDFGED